VHALREADPTPAAVLAGVVMRALAHCDVRPPGVVALAGTADAGALAPAIFTLAAAGWSLRDGTGLAARLRKAKHDADLASIRRAADGAMAAFRAIARRLAHASIDGDGSESPGALRDADGFVRVGRLRREVAACMLAAGLTQPEGNIIAPGDEGGVPHSVGDDDRVIRAGESLVVDLFPRDRLFADCTRTFCVGPPPPALQHAYATVRAALEHAERSSRPGVRAWTLQQQVCERFAADGYATLLDDPHLTEGYVHGLGHGVGHALHELPSFRETASDDDGRLDVDDVITLEPGLYAPSAGYGVRIEDLYVMRDDGPANLTPLPRDLDPRRWIESP
ncbi:MAG: M24 family metallopeptidase, partial [Acidobacteriota bacterium]